MGHPISLLIDADNYLKEVSRYIHLNPVRIKRYSGVDIKYKTKILKEYQFCSMAGYSNIKKRESFVNYKTVLDYFGGDMAESRRMYNQFVYKGRG